MHVGGRYSSISGFIVEEQIFNFDALFTRNPAFCNLLWDKKIRLNPQNKLGHITDIPRTVTNIYRNETFHLFSIFLTT